MDLRLDRSMFVRVVLLFVAFIVPLTGAGAILIGQQSMRIGLTERELDGILLTKHTIAVVCNMRALRDRLAFRNDGAALQAPVDCDTSTARGRMAVARDVARSRSTRAEIWTSSMRTVVVTGPGPN